MTGPATVAELATELGVPAEVVARHASWCLNETAVDALPFPATEAQLAACSRYPAPAPDTLLEAADANLIRFQLGDPA